jgi:hypothetical protein
MKLKGQKSLEMIIGLIMLLVVAAVVIGIFLNYFVESGQLDKLRGGAQSKVEMQQFISNCEKLCNDFLNSGNPTQASAFCEEHRELDLDGDKTVTIAEATTKKYRVCEKKVYCFMVYDCKLPKGNKLDWQKCRDVECSVYMDLYDGNRNKAYMALLENIDPGTCKLPAETSLNWWDKFGYGTPCGS